MSGPGRRRASSGIAQQGERFALAAWGAPGARESRVVAGARRFAVATLALLLTACAAVPPPCPSGQQAMVSDLLYFGTATPDGQVSADDWRRFLDAVVTPRFPQGLTVWQASGQWQSQAGPVVQEPSLVLSLVHAGSVASETAVADIVGSYKSRFRQEAVLRVRSRVCVSF